MNGDIEEAHRALSRLDAEVRAHPRQPETVLVRCERGDLRAVKTRLQRLGYSYQPRTPVPRLDGDWHVFKPSGGSRGPPRNGRELTRGIQQGDLDLI